MFDRGHIHGDKGDKKGNLRLTHFAIIPAGMTYESEEYYEEVRDMFFGDKKALVTYSNFKDLKLNMTELEDDMPAIYHTYGFNFFVDQSTEESITETYRRTRREKMTAKKEDEAMNDVDYNTSYRDLVFAKTTGVVVR